MKTIKDTPRVEDDDTPTYKVTFNQLVNEIEKVNNDSVTYCETNYPEMCTEFKRIMVEQYLMFCNKQKNYGPGNISVGTALTTADDIKLSLTGLWFRMNDKIQRLKQLIVLGHRDAVGESETDTFQDLSVYGIIAQLVSRKKWAK